MLNFIKKIIKRLFPGKPKKPEPGTPKETEPEIILSQNEDVQETEPLIQEDQNNTTMMDEVNAGEGFKSSEPLISYLSSFLSSRLKQLRQTGDESVNVPHIPDWTNSGKTLSANFSRFIRELDLKREEEYVEETTEEEDECAKKNGIIPALRKRHIPFNDDEKWVLIIALVPHIYPHFYDEVIFKHLENPGEYPQLGFIRGKEFRGFLPTGETIFFFLAGNNFNRRLEIQQIFQSNHFFSIKKLIWLEELTKGEPVMSGKIILSPDYLDTVMFGKPVPPVFSINFPARQIQTDLEWEDLVLSKDLRKQIEDIKNWLKFNQELEDQWGNKRRLKLGYRSLFYGPSGTGKTLSASLLGKATGKDVYKIDLSMVVSKFIGETEKNLEMLFARAEDKGWILFFDEADALFGKRTNVRDAHDKYANQEVSYLLQRIEDYNGLVILATNMKGNIDDAFIRRFNSILSFTAPTTEERTLIWRKSFPPNSVFYKKAPGDLLASLNDLETLDIPDAVRKYELTGGNIINIIHYAGIKAIEQRERRKNAMKKNQKYAYADAGCEDDDREAMQETNLVFYLSDILDGIRREMIKEGKPFTV